MPLPIKTAVRIGGAHTVRAVLATMSFAADDVSNLVGQDVDPLIRIDTAPSDDAYPAARVVLTFYYVPPAGPPVQHHVEVGVPGYILWDGHRLDAVTPRAFAQQYEVVSRYTPPPRHLG
jgi:hypothetical protein